MKTFDKVITKKEHGIKGLNDVAFEYDHAARMTVIYDRAGVSGFAPIGHIGGKADQKKVITWLS